MVIPTKVHLRHVLLADDGSQTARAAADLLTRLPIASECTVTALRVFTPLEAAEYATVAHSIETTRDILAASHLNVHLEMSLGYPTEKIIEYANAHAPDLIVLGAKSAGRGLGSVAMNIVHDGRWPVLIVREPHNALSRVLLVTDGSDCSQAAGHYLGIFPLPQDTRVEVMHVLSRMVPGYVADPMGMAVMTLPPEQEADWLREEEVRGQAALRQTCSLLEASGLLAEPILVRGEVAHEIVTYAREQDVDLIVCGSRGLGSMTGWLLGSVSRDLVKDAHCSVMVVRCPRGPE